MAFQICPNCGAESFLWTIDNEPYTITDWFCHNCNYEAVEDERLERTCSKCGSKSEILLVDKNGSYWWCLNCHQKTVVAV